MARKRSVNGTSIESPWRRLLALPAIVAARALPPSGLHVHQRMRKKAPARTPGLLQRKIRRSVAGSVVTLGAEHHRDDALVLDGVGAGWACSNAACEIGSPGEGRLDLGVVDIDAEPEVLGRVPLRARADIPEIVIGIAVRHAVEGGVEGAAHRRADEAGRVGIIVDMQIRAVE